MWTRNILFQRTDQKNHFQINGLAKRTYFVGWWPAQLTRWLTGAYNSTVALGFKRRGKPMCIYRGISSALFAGALVFGVCQANAAVIISSQSITDFVTDPGSNNPAPNSQTPLGIVTFPTDSAAGTTRSPFENVNETHGPGYGNPYTNIAAGGTATWNFFSSTQLSILWGSPDTYNTLTFFSGADGGGTNLGSFTGANLLLNSRGHDTVVFTSSDAFLSVVLSTTQNAFEFTNLSACGGENRACAPVVTPLPAALPLFVSGLGSLGFFGFWRKRKQKLAAA
jgi:hypothetical protein